MFRSIRSFLLLLTLAVLSIPALSYADDTPIPQASNGNGVTVKGYLWNDANCDGIRQNTEAPLSGNPSGGQSMSIFYVGSDSIPFTSDDTEVGVSGALNGWPTYQFSNGGQNGTFYIAIRPRDRPVGFIPTLWQQGSDTTIDNDLKLWPNGAWATGTFIIPNLTGFIGGPDAVAGIDIGLCDAANISRPYQVSLPLVTH
jgi:hypothetical protein